MDSENQSNLGKKLGSELLKPTFDLSVDYSEIFIDNIIDNETLQEIPFIKTIVGVVRTGISVNKIFLVKKLLTFIQQFNNNSIEPSKIENFRNKFNSDSRYRSKVMEQIAIFNDRFIDIKKSKISANLFTAYIQELITFEQFINLNISLDQIHPSSYTFMALLSSSNFEIDGNKKGQQRNRDAEAMLLSSGIATETSAFAHGFKITADGKKLFELGIKPIIEQNLN